MREDLNFKEIRNPLRVTLMGPTGENEERRERIKNWINRDESSPLKSRTKSIYTHKQLQELERHTHVSWYLKKMGSW